MGETTRGASKALMLALWSVRDTFIRMEDVCPERDGSGQCNCKRETHETIYKHYTPRYPLRSYPETPAQEPR